MAANVPIEGQAGGVRAERELRVAYGREKQRERDRKWDGERHKEVKRSEE